jgi:hypothetical protein
MVQSERAILWIDEEECYSKQIDETNCSRIRYIVYLLVRAFCLPDR